MVNSKDLSEDLRLQKFESVAIKHPKRPQNKKNIPIENKNLFNKINKL